MGLDSGSSPTASPSRESVTISSSPLAVYTFRAASAFSISTPPAGISSSTALIMPASPWLTASSSAWVGLTTAVISHWDRSSLIPFHTASSAMAFWRMGSSSRAASPSRMAWNLGSSSVSSTTRISSSAGSSSKSWPGTYPDPSAAGLSAPVSISGMGTLL